MWLRVWEYVDTSDHCAWNVYCVTATSTVHTLIFLSPHPSPHSQLRKSHKENAENAREIINNGLIAARSTHDELPVWEWQKKQQCCFLPESCLFFFKSELWIPVLFLAQSSYSHLLICEASLSSVYVFKSRVSFYQPLISSQWKIARV